MIITSAQNPRIQLIRGLLEKKKERTAAQSFIAEGVRLIEEAFQAGWKPSLVLVADNLSERGRALASGLAATGSEVLEVSASLLASLSDTEASQGILAVLPFRNLPLPERLDFVVVADQLRDPGNLGTLIRTSAAAGAQALVLTPGTTDAFAPKVVRSGMGAHFRLPILNLTWAELAGLCSAQETPLSIYVAESAGGLPCWSLDLRKPVALVVGGEADGASPEAVHHSTGNIFIPMPGKTESLNAAIAAGILLFEVVRQRSL